MPENKNTNWGEWIKARARFVGIRNQIDLAMQIGCRHEQISRWNGLSEPPKKMFKGFDKNLAIALRVDRKTLFSDFRKISPEAAEVVDENTPHLASDNYRRRVLAMLELMPNDGLKELARVGEQILHKGMLQVA